MDDLQRLSIQGQCRDLMTLYCWHIDHKSPQAFAGLWAQDGMYKPAAEPLPIKGRAAILAWIEAYPTERLGRHLSTNQYVVVLDADRAIGTSYAVVFREENPRDGDISVETEPRSIVEYVDRFRRTDEGWRFAERVYRILFLQEAAAVRPSPWAEFPTSSGSLQL